VSKKHGLYAGVLTPEFAKTLSDDGLDDWLAIVRDLAHIPPV